MTVPRTCTCLLQLGLGVSMARHKNGALEEISVVHTLSAYRSCLAAKLGSSVGSVFGYKSRAAISRDSHGLLV